MKRELERQDERRRDFGIVEFPFVMTPVSKAQLA